MNDITFLGMNEGQQVLASLIALVGAILAAVIATTGKRVTAAAALRTSDASVQATLNLAFKQYTEQLHEDRGDDRVRIQNLEDELGRARALMLQMEGTIVSLQQELASLESIMRRAGMDIPERKKAVPIVLLDSEGARQRRGRGNREAKT